ncbi:MAG: hypothetical protein ACI9WU_000677, partial [Myxococcota bacterium]
MVFVVGTDIPDQALDLRIQIFSGPGPFAPRMRTATRLLTLLSFLLPLTASGAPPSYADLPSDGAQSPVKLRIVKYTGSTNGGMIVEVRNTGSSAAEFTADGLFFVPKGDAESAPQRLGAAGPF